MPVLWPVIICERFVVCGNKINNGINKTHRAPSIHSLLISRSIDDDVPLSVRLDPVNHPEREWAGALFNTPLFVINCLLIACSTQFIAKVMRFIKICIDLIRS